MSWAMWMTGPPGGATSTLVQLAAARLAAQGEPVTVLELERIRSLLTPRPTDSEGERDLVCRALVFMAVALTEAGVPVLIEASGDRQAWRDLARASITRFAEILIERPDRLPADLVAAAACHSPVLGAGGKSPELTVDMRMEPLETAADRVAGLRRTWPTTGPRRDTGAVIWITGPPGSGKTTQGSRLAEALAAEGVEVAILEWTTLRATVLGGAVGSERENDVAHRALVYTAKLLADAGLTVIVDATAPRRAWRSLARELVGRFAEVQLVCPPETCLVRERAARWGPRPCPHRGDVAPDIVLDYEYSLGPDLVLDTGSRSEWSAGEDLLRLARRLRLRRFAS
jgi:adenylylsulfate kinase-like enzyme